MKLYTIQNIEILNDIVKKGYYVPSIDKVNTIGCGQIFNRAYKWMIQEMENRIIPFEHHTYPIWAWYNRKNINEIIEESIFEDNIGYILIELEIPDNEVCLSDFDMWHTILNNSFCEIAANDSLYKKYKDMKYNIPISIELKEKSWKRIFDIHTEMEYYNHEYIQATFWTIKKEYIKSFQCITKMI